jgi:uncharacterized membrane protein YfcA
MALSNFRREPRRELTESAIGIGFTIVWLSADYFISSRLYHPVPKNFDWPILMFVMILVGMGAPFLAYLLLHLTHAVGEVVCGWLKAVNLDPRPKQRY